MTSPHNAFLKPRRKWAGAVLASLCIGALGSLAFAQEAPDAALRWLHRHPGGWPAHL